MKGGSGNNDGKLGLIVKEHFHRGQTGGAEWLKESSAYTGKAKELGEIV